MIDITKLPYFFSNNQIIIDLMCPLKSQEEVRFLNMVRKYTNGERFSIIHHAAHTIDWYKNKFYEFSTFENKEELNQQSAIYLWDHTKHTQQSLQIKEYNLREHNIAHGLTIIKKHENYADYFNFSSYAFNKKINNFYVNQIELFNEFISKFYIHMHKTITEVSRHRIVHPSSPQIDIAPHLSNRQLECALLLIEGYSSKEIGKQLSLSYRTIDEYINTLILKFKAKNRMHLMKILIETL